MHVHILFAKHTSRLAYPNSHICTHCCYLMLWLITTVLWSGATSICDGFIYFSDHYWPEIGNPKVWRTDLPTNQLTWEGARDTCVSKKGIMQSIQFRFEAPGCRLNQMGFFIYKIICFDFQLYLWYLIFKPPAELTQQCKAASFNLAGGRISLYDHSSLNSYLTTPPPFLYWK